MRVPTDFNQCLLFCFLHRHCTVVRLSTAANLLADLRDYEVAVPVRVDRYGVVFRPPTLTSRRHSSAGLRTRRSLHVSATASPSVDDVDQLDFSASSLGKPGLDRHIRAYFLI